MAAKGKQAALIEHDGESLSLKQWSERYGLSHHTVYNRLRKGCSMAEALRPTMKRSEYGDVMVTIRMTAETRERLNSAAKAINHSLNEFCLSTVLKAVEQMA